MVLIWKIILRFSFSIAMGVFGKFTTFSEQGLWQHGMILFSCNENSEKLLAAT